MNEFSLHSIVYNTVGTLICLLVNAISILINYNIQYVTMYNVQLFYFKDFKFKYLSNQIWKEYKYTTDTNH